MRQKTKMSGLVSHTKPSGESYQSAKNKCEQKLKKLQNLLDEGYKLVNISKKDDSLTPKRVKIQAGFITIIVEFEDWQANGSIGKVVEKYY